MKIRIKGDTIRLRLSQTEVSKIGAFIPVIETTHFGANSLVYELVTHHGEEPILTQYINNVITISIQEDLAKNWADSETVGIESVSSAIPSVLIEKDFQCLTVRQGEDETDLFHNPNTSC